jgi:hypothetical protein
MPAPAAKESMSAHIAQNIESVLDLQRREQSSTAPSRRFSHSFAFGSGLITGLLSSVARPLIRRLSHGSTDC